MPREDGMSLWMLVGLVVSILMVFASWLNAEREIARLNRENDTLHNRCRDLETILTDAVAAISATPQAEKPYWAAILEDDLKLHYLKRDDPDLMTRFYRIRRRLILRRVLYFWRGYD